MKKLKNIVSILLVFTLVNVVVGKTVHELFFHHHDIECSSKTDKHFHEVEFFDNDVICDYHFSFSTESTTANQFVSLNNYKDYIEKTRYIQFVKNVFLTTPSLRGPPIKC